MSHTRNVFAIAALAALLATACGPTAEEVSELREQQAEILAKLAKLEEGQDKILKSRGGAAKPARPAEDFDKVHDIDVDSAPMLGKADAAITIVEFSDFQCPFCANAAPLVKQVQDKYPDQVRVVYKHFPLNFHPMARPAAIASLAAQEQDKFWEMHDVLFKNSRSLSEDKMPEYATEAGLDVERFKADYEKKQAEYDKRVTADYQDGVKADVRGTPTLYINGKKVRQRSVEGMSAQIEAELKKDSES
jgi:protein-disulfide isomerase